MGRGIYGVEAASSHYFRVTARSSSAAAGDFGGSPAEAETLGSDEAKQQIAMAPAAHSAT